MTLLNLKEEEFQISDQGMAIGAIAEEEIERLKKYREIYQVTHPFPEKPDITKLSFWKMMGMEAGAFYAAAIGGVVLAAIRTGGLFMATEELILRKMQANTTFFNQLLPTLTLISSLFAFEGYLFAMGLRKGRESGRLNTSPWGTGAAFIVSVLAGTISSLPIVDVDTSLGVGLALSWSLAIAMGTGATILAYLGAENVGVLHNVHENKISTLVSNWKIEAKAWYSTFQGDYRGKGRSRVFGMEGYSEKAEKKEGKSPGLHIKQVRDYLQVHNLSAHDIGPSSKGYSTSPEMMAEDLKLKKAGEKSALRTYLTRLRKEEQKND